MRYVKISLTVVSPEFTLNFVLKLLKPYKNVKIVKTHIDILLLKWSVLDPKGGVALQPCTMYMALLIL
jgi:hypothetical protein